MLTRAERLALLLTLLGEEAQNIARSALQGKVRTELDEALRDFEEHPASDEEISLVLEDFQSYFRLAAHTVFDGEAGVTATGRGGQRSVADGEDEPESPADGGYQGPRILQLPEEQFEVEFEPERRFESPAPSGNIKHDLNRLHPYQVAAALKSESIQIAAIVVSCLANEHAAKTLEFLPEAQRNEVVIELTKPFSTRPQVVQRILDATLQMALKVKERQIEMDSSEKLSNVLRSLPKKLRGPIMEDINTQDAEMAEAIKSKLYRWEDLGKLTKRDMQTFLGQCKTEVLVVALQQADPSLLQKILENMSKRAKETLQEEMELSTNAKQDEIEQERATLIAVMAELDESGAIEVA